VFLEAIERQCYSVYVVSQAVLFHACGDNVWSNTFTVHSCECFLWPLQVLGAESREQLRAVVALYATVSIGVVQRRHHCSEEVVSALVHSLKSGLTSHCIDLKAASYMILSQLCVSTTLNTSIVNRLVGKLAKVKNDVTDFWPVL